MILKKIAEHRYITIQCHDNPDADTIAAGFGLYMYFNAIGGHRVRLIYSGDFKIRKKSLVTMIETLGIPIEYVNNLYRPNGILVTVDCQYKGGNVTPLTAEHVAIIDHHEPHSMEYIENDNLNILHDIRSDYGSCSTVVWKLLNDAHFETNTNTRLATALLYGLLTDVGDFSQMYNPIDRDMYDSLHADRNLLKILHNSNLSRKELEIAGLALLRTITNDTYHFAVLKANHCDSNILGLISDICLQVDSINTCIVYSEHPDYIKFSVRSCVREVQSNELAEFMAYTLGNGGGHHDKAGGTIMLQAFRERYPDVNSEAFFIDRYYEYFHSRDIIDTKTYSPDIRSMRRCQERRIPHGYVYLSALYEPGTDIMVRTLDGDKPVMVQADTCAVLDIHGLVSIMSSSEFEKTFETVDSPFTLSVPYTPTTRTAKDAKILEKFAKTCMPKNHSDILVKELTKATKLFPRDENAPYSLGLPGDFLAIYMNDPKNPFIINKDTFENLYS
ncbi:MAG: DHH family phosphoesterase [Lachnospiraceae bacterium]|nr:DHH family phosphoesterase [Lachnospiraceae bacterium]